MFQFATPGLSLVQRKVQRSNYLDFDDEISVSVSEMENAFIHHFDDRSIKVADCTHYFTSLADIWLQISNMRMRRGKTGAGHYEVEVFTKGILRVSGRRRVDLHVRIVRDGQSLDKEIVIYNTLLRHVRSYLAKKYVSQSKVLPLADSLDVTKFMKTENLPIDYTERIFILENKSHLGFKKDLMNRSEGLDYEHSVLGNKLCVKSFIYFIFLIQQSQHWPDSMRVPIVTFETQKYRLSDITRYYSSQLLYQLYQKKQLRKSTNFSNLILSTESITIFSSEKQ